MPNHRARLFLEAAAAVFFAACGAPAQSPPALSLQWIPSGAQLHVTGDIGSPCTVQVTSNLGGPWQPLASLTLLSGAADVADPAPAVAGARFYRALAPAPTNALWIPAGVFFMGSPTNEVERNTNELGHSVTLTKGYYLGKTLVTQGAYLSLLITNPSYFNTNNGFSLDLTRPVERVSWQNATNYCYLLTQQERAAGRIFTNWSYRLPTEAEWEYACRAGSTNPFCYGNDLRSGMANFDGEYEYIGGTGTSFNPTGTVLNRTTGAGSYATNNWGLLDMVGNTWEWCADWFGPYGSAAITDPQGPGTGTSRVLRGGAFNSPGKSCRSAFRNSANPVTAVNTVGFRVVLAYGP